MVNAALQFSETGRLGEVMEVSTLDLVAHPAYFKMKTALQQVQKAHFHKNMFCE
jgi:hypothetical protein